jgi:2-polyprenyl-3-methyl-5-hydroxy-6-metoxy-1,4-benzoquinol methylase
MSEQDHVYQLGYAEQYAEYQFDAARQDQKAQKVLAVLQDHYGGPESLRDLSLLDMGCSAGLMTKPYSEKFGRVVGIDIDAPAVEYASHTYSSEGLQFLVRDAMETGLPSETFNVVTCTHIYEHVPDYHKLIAEIYRVLKPGGICYFAAHNRLCLVEPHYGLPLLSVLPKPLAHRYLRLFGKGNHYYENLLPLGRLRRLVSRFEIIDYTKQVIQDPVKFHATDLLAPGSLQQKAALAILAVAYFLCPTFIWLLRKR